MRSIAPQRTLQEVEENHNDPSAVIYVNETNTKRRQIHLLSLMPLTNFKTGNGVDSIQNTVVGYETAAYFAVKDFNERSPRILPHLPKLLEGCDLQMSMEMRNTDNSARTAINHLQDAMKNRFTRPTARNVTNRFPVAFLGERISSTSMKLATLGAVYEIPQISGTATSINLDDKARFPYFSRAIPSNEGDAEAIVEYLYSLNVPYFGVLYVNDGYGLAYRSGVQRQAKKRGLQLFSTGYIPSDEKTIAAAVNSLQKSDVKWIVCVPSISTWRVVVEEASAINIMGTSEHQWFFTDAFPLRETLQESETHLAKALDGVGVVRLDIQPNEAFDRSMHTFWNDTRQQQEYTAWHSEPSILQDYGFPPNNIINFYHYTKYDGIIALGLAACQIKNDFFRGPEMLQSLRETDFLGTSGYVTFHPHTGTRDNDGLSFTIRNLRLVDDPTLIISEAEIAVRVNLGTSDPITSVRPFFYAGNTTQAPLVLPEFEDDLNLIPAPLRIVGLFLAAVAMLSSIGWLLWTIKHRKHQVVRIAQPVFLGKAKTPQMLLLI